MKTLWIPVLLLFTSYLMAESTSRMVFIPQDQLSKLEQQFTQSTPPNIGFLRQSLRKKWRCELYGARTQAQVKNNLELYKFIPVGVSTSENGLYKNNGTQVTKLYSLTKSRFYARQGEFIDEVRAKGQTLIAKTQHVSADGTLSTLTYSLCK